MNREEKKALRQLSTLLRAMSTGMCKFKVFIPDLKKHIDVEIETIYANNPTYRCVACNILTKGLQKEGRYYDNELEQFVDGFEPFTSERFYVKDIIIDYGN